MPFSLYVTYCYLYPVPVQFLELTTTKLAERDLEEICSHENKWLVQVKK